MKNQSQPNTRAFQFQFDLQIQKIKLLTTISIPKSSYLQIIWRRGQKNISTKIKPEIKGTEEEIFFGETLSMISTCALNIDTNEFSLKDSIVSAVIYISGSQKLFGSVTINLSSVLNHNYLQKGVKFIEEELNGRAKSKIFMKLTSNYLKQMVKGDEQQSVGSGVHSSFNTSSYSIADRRLVDIPSKDTYSVLSYGGAIRYSARKEDGTSIRRQDSSKKLQQKASRQYGRFGGYGQNNYSKSIQQYNLSQGTPYTPGNLNTLTSNTNNSPSYSNNTPQTIITPQITGSSNIKSASVSSSTNRIIRSSDSEHNRSSIGENNRQLAEQQTRRSKLEAEVTKNKVENDELKNKLNEYVRQNMKIKEQMRKFYESNDNKQLELKKQNQELKQRNYVLVSEVRQLKTRFDKYINLQRQCSSLRNERQGLLKQCKKWQQQVLNLKKQIEQSKMQLQRTKESQYRLTQEVNDLKMVKNTSEENRKKQVEGKVKQMSSQIEYYQNSSKNLSMLLREAQEKSRNLQRQLLAAKKQNESECRKINESLAGKDKQIKELNDKIYLKNQECSKYILEAQKAKSDYLKFRDEKANQAENNKAKLASEVERLTGCLKEAISRADQLQQEKLSLNTQVRNEMLLRAKQTEKLKQLQESFSQGQKKWQKQLGELRKAIQQLQMQNLQLNKILSQKTRNIQQTQSYKEQIQGLMKHNLQLQLQIKYKNEEMQKLAKLEQQYQNLKCKSSIQENNIKQLSQNLEKVQRECRQKNRSYILECEKSKMLMEERMNISKNNTVLKQQLDRAKEIMFNGERQFQQMKICIEDLQNRNIALTAEVRKLQDKLLTQNAEKYINDVKVLETRNRELEMRDAQKIKSIQSLHRSLSNSNKQIKDLQVLSEQRYQQVLNREQMIQSLQVKLQELEEIRVAMNKEMQSSNQEKKNILKKNEVIMDELFSYKRRLQQERGRSHSTIQVRNSQDYVKIKNLQNELNKRDEKIRKLEKEMISLENQNVNLSIQVMKRLQDITPK